MPIAKDTRFPLLNSIRFTPANDGLATNYNTFPADRGFFFQQLRNYQTKNLYRQPFNYTDNIYTYHDTLAPESDLWILDDTGAVIAGPFPALPAAAVPGNTVNVDGVDYIYNSIFTLWNLSSLYTMTQAEQTIYLVFEDVYNVPGDNESLYFVSEPIHVRRYGWQNTMLIEATQTKNNYDVMFQQVGAKFAYRLECDVTDDVAPGFEDVVFTDQLQQLRQLDSTPFRLWTLIIKNAPGYAIDKINRALSCAEFKIDGTRYIKDTGANFSLDVTDNDPLKSAKIQLREYDLKEQGHFIALKFVPIVSLIRTGDVLRYPIAINKIKMGGIEYGTTTILENPADMTAFLNDLNTTFVTAHSLGGDFEIRDGYLGYMPVVGETLVASAGCYAFCDYWAMEITSRTLAPHPISSLTFNLGATGAQGLAIIDYGFGTASYHTLPVGNAYTSFGAWYPGAGLGLKKTMRIFHHGVDGNSTTRLEKFSMTDTNAPAWVTDLPYAAGMSVPPSLKVWNMVGQNLNVPTLDVTILESARQSLEWVAFQSCRIQNLNLFDASGFTITTWPKITTVLLNGNAINAANIMQLILRMAFTSSPNRPSGTGMFKQTPVAPVTGGQLSYLNNLVSSYGWTVTHD